MGAKGSRQTWVERAAERSGAKAASASWKSRARHPTAGPPIAVPDAAPSQAFGPEAAAAAGEIEAAAAAKKEPSRPPRPG